MTASSLQVGFVMEQTLGHVAYTQNLQSAYAAGDRLDPRWIPIPFKGSDLLDRFPVARNNWAVRGSLRAYRALRQCGSPLPLDALVFHTSTVALAASLAAREMPVILSLDATPLNYDGVGAHYGHIANPASLSERVKQAIWRNT